MAKLPDQDALGGLPNVSVPGGLPSADMSVVGKGYQGLANGIEKLGLGISLAYKEEEDHNSAIAQAEYSIADGKIYSAAGQNEDYEKAPVEYSTASHAALKQIADTYFRDEKKKAEFIAKNSVNTEAKFNVLDRYAFKKKNEATELANDGRIQGLIQDGIQAVQDPDNPNWDYYNQRVTEARDVIEAESRLMKRTPAAHRRRMQSFIGAASKEAITSIMLQNPEAAKRILEGLTPGPADEIKPGTGKFDRSPFQQEIDASPDLADRLQTIVQGEVGHNAPPDKKLIALESIFNRAAARGQSLAQVTKEYTGKGSDGYYPGTTFRNGAIRNDAERSDFRENVLDMALAGSDRSTELLGFPATGNASQGVAARGATNGRYKQYASLEGKDPGTPGVETWVSGHGNDNIERLNGTRLSEGERQPSVMVSDNTGLVFKPSDAMKLMKQADTIIRNREIEAKRTKARETEAAKAASTEEVFRVMPLIQKNDPSVTLEKIWEDSPENPLTLEHRRYLDGVVRREDKPEPERVKSAATLRGLTEKVNKDEIKSPDAFLEAYGRGELSSPDLDRGLKRLQDKMAGKDLAYEKRIVQMSERAKTLFRKNSILPDAEADAQWDTWEFDLRAKVRKAAEEGKNPDDFLNPHSKEYFLSPEVISSYKPSATELIRRQTQQFRRSSAPSTGAPAPATTPSPDLKRKDGESMDDYLKRRGL